MVALLFGHDCPEAMHTPVAIKLLVFDLLA